MKHLIATITITLAFTGAIPAMADTTRDCLLTGTVSQEAAGSQSTTRIDIHSIDKFEEGSRCRVRRGQKLEFKLPQDTRLKTAPTGSEVQYRYRSNKDGSSRTDLISIGA